MLKTFNSDAIWRGPAFPGNEHGPERLPVSIQEISQPSVLPRAPENRADVITSSFILHRKLN